jgi:hypothetical protein
MKRRVTREDLQRDQYAVWNAYVDLIADSKHYEAMNEIQRVAQLAFRYESEVQNGGHLQFFENEPAAVIEPTLASLGAIGAEVYAPILSEAISRRRSKQGKTLESIEDYIAEALEDEFADLDEAYYMAQPPMIELLENYLNKWQDEFVVVDS